LPNNKHILHRKRALKYASGQSQVKVNSKHWVSKSSVILDSILNYGGQVVSRVESTDYSRATTVVHKHEYHLRLSLVRTG